MTDESVPIGELEALVDRYKQEEQHVLTPENEKVVFGTVISDLNKLIEEYTDD